MNVWLAIIVLNLAYFAIFVPLELWRHTRQERLEALKQAGPACQRGGWHPVAFRWRGPLHTQPEFELRHADGRKGFARADG